MTDPTDPRPEPTLTVGKPATVAGGPGAARSIASYCLDHLGPVRAVRTLSHLNQHRGFDCPGCAWPDPEHRGLVELCENGARAVADEATRYRADPDFWAAHSVAELSGWSDHQLNRAGRITHPMVLRPGATHYVPIDWDEAFALVGRHLRALPHPDAAIFYTSGRTSNEAAFLYQLFVRRFGTNNLPDCSNMCHESSGTGMTEVLGIGKGTVTLHDVEQAEVIVVVGQNPGTNHPRMLTSLQTAKRAGARIVAINPLREAALVAFQHPKELAGWVGSGTEIADLYLQVRINGDVALLQGVMKSLVERHDRGEPALDVAFLDAHTTGLEPLLEQLRATPWEVLVTASGVDRPHLEAVAELLARHSRIVICWAMGVTQHVNGVANVQSIVNLLLLRGALGKPGAGACPVRGHSNVQGDRTMGIWEKPPEAFLDALAQRFGFEPPRRHGTDTVDAIRAMRDGTAQVFVGMGGNFVSATPDTDVTAAALRRCALTVQVSTKPNRSHLVHGATALILPCLGRTERHVTVAGPQLVTVENSMGVVHSSQGNLPPASPHLLSEPEIVARMADATLGPDADIPWRALADDLDGIRDHIAAVVPGFEDLNTRVRRPGGFLLPNPVRDALRFDVPGGKARLTVHPLPEHDLGERELLMMTLRSHDQYNTTVYTLDDRYRGIHGGRRVVLVAAKDLARLGLVDGQVVTLRSVHDGRVRTAPGFRIVTYDIPPGCVATYFPEANVLVPLDHTAVGSQTPASKSVVVTLEP